MTSHSGGNTSQLAREKFAETFNGQPNFVTPNAIRYGKAGAYAYELAHGTGMFGGKLYGVSVIQWRDGAKTDLGQSFESEKAANRYISQLRALK